ncbi:MAG: TonB-dependent receptor [Alphaproteobacteria bacterium]|nr:MAG: TonB-dependent receptor [Alphaproteobacteria bacterium]
MANIKHSLWGASCIAIAATTTTGVAAQESQDTSAAASIEEVVVTGSRRAARSAADTPAPVDVISGDDFANQGTGDMSDMLRTVVPSYNVNAMPINDASTLIRPANLRGLAPDQTLVLLNGKRRHRAAVITFLGGGLSDGAQGPDIGVIPSIALKRVEVLRDGASAQYGSDAIAGVMNFVLRDDSEGGSFQAKWGKTYDGGGTQKQLAANVGLPVTDDGFMNISAEWREASPTSRSVQRDDAAGLIAGGNTDVKDPAQVWGTPEVRNDWKAFFNFGIQATEKAELYAFGNYAEREVEGGFFYRNPDTRAGVNTADGGVTRLVGDMDPYDGVTCPGGINFATGEIDNPLVIGSDTEADMMAQIAADPNCWVFNEMFPGGFTPQFGGNLNDAAIAVGVRGELDSGLMYDVSAHVGRNQADFFILNTVNPSLGSATPNDFDLGSYIQLEKNFNAEVSYPVEIGLYSPLNIAGGFEWREEQFEARTGQPESFEAGVLAAPIDIDGLGPMDPISQGFGIGANGFNGFSPQVAGSWDRTNIAFYVDMEADVTEKLVLGAALRWEDFSDFGSTTNFKVSGLYKFSDAFRLRSSYSTGFRAPTPGQQQVVNISTVFENVDGVLQLAQRGTIPPTNPIAQAKGAEALGPEKSDNFSVGFVADVGAVNVTVDYFNIKLKDRITQSASQTLTAQERSDLLASGITFAADLQAFRFYVNDFDTKTEGIDVVATIPLDLFEDGTTQVAFAGNYTKTKVTDFDPNTLDSCRVQLLEENLPNYRFNTTFSHATDKWRMLARGNYYGSYFEAHLDACDLPINAGSEITFDAEIGYNVMENLEVSIGAENLFNNYPDVNPWGGVAGAKYPVTSPMGFNGGFYYVRARYSF